MNFDSTQKIAAAILYEGYILYPYRKTAIKNRQRWNFGTLYPRVYAGAQRPGEPFRLQAECLLEGGANAALDIRISFLQLLQTSASRPADSRELADPSLAWEEAVERTAEFADLQLETLKSEPWRRTVTIDSTNLPDGAPVTQSPELTGTLAIRAEQMSASAWKLHLEFQNDSPLPSGAAATREEALPRSFVSAHVLLGARHAEFISLLEPPEEYRDAVANCNQIGIFPVLAGDAPDRHTVFCSPIILYDYPSVAPESEGDFFDGTEMDEMLALRVMTLTDEEKQEMRDGDPRARRILERTEAMTPEMMMKAHGVIRGIRSIAPTQEDQP
jgi:hypothetical protein